MRGEGRKGQRRPSKKTTFTIFLRIGLEVVDSPWRECAQRPWLILKQLLLQCRAMSLKELRAGHDALRVWKNAAYVGLRQEWVFNLII